MSDSIFHSKIQHNNVNKSGLSEEGTSPSKFFVELQAEIGCYYATATVRKRRKWISHESQVVMECYIAS